MKYESVADNILNLSQLAQSTNCLPTWKNWPSWASNANCLSSFSCFLPKTAWFWPRFAPRLCKCTKHSQDCEFEAYPWLTILQFPFLVALDLLPSPSLEPSASHRLQASGTVKKHAQNARECPVTQYLLFQTSIKNDRSSPFHHVKVRKLYKLRPQLFFLCMLLPQSLK